VYQIVGRFTNNITDNSNEAVLTTAMFQKSLFCEKIFDASHLTRSELNRFLWNSQREKTYRLISLSKNLFSRWTIHLASALYDSLTSLSYFLYFLPIFFLPNIFAISFLIFSLFSSLIFSLFPIWYFLFCLSNIFPISSLTFSLFFSCLIFSLFPS
jgi:hypothetical protein